MRERETSVFAIMSSAPAAPPQLPPPPVWNCGGIVGIDMPTVWWSQEDEGLAITVCINLAVSAGCLVPRATSTRATITRATTATVASLAATSHTSNIFANPPSHPHRTGRVRAALACAHARGDHLRATRRAGQHHPPGAVGVVRVEVS